MLSMEIAEKKKLKTAYNSVLLTLQLIFASNEVIYTLLSAPDMLSYISTNFTCIIDQNIP